jgi:hypothetical protein
VPRNGNQFNTVSEWADLYAQSPGEFSGPYGLYYVVNPVSPTATTRTGDDITDFRFTLIELEIGKKERVGIPATKYWRRYRSSMRVSFGASYRSRRSTPPAEARVSMPWSSSTPRTALSGSVDATRFTSFAARWLASITRTKIQVG